ncbi:MAG: 4Fe-4S dicluster domain-containing protein [Armatimonadetes bacterium]|nr:4Fe-4S dicluster domain-containing protein [Armatimonadota bacterium]
MVTSEPHPSMRVRMLGLCFSLNRDRKSQMTTYGLDCKSSPNKDSYHLKELAGNICRGCGYYLPCSANIPIPMAARMGLCLRRMPYQQFMTPHWHEMMHRIESCTDCGHCRANCPYGLDTPALLRRMLSEYEEFFRN